MLVTLAMRFNWDPLMVGQMDPHFIDELMARLAAEARHAEDNKPKGKGGAG